MFGSIIPAPLAMPHTRPPAAGWAQLRVAVGRHDRARGGQQRVALQRLGELGHREHHRVERRPADHAVGWRTASPPPGNAAASHLPRRRRLMPSARPFEILLFEDRQQHLSDSPCPVLSARMGVRVKAAAQLDVGLSTTAVRFIVAVIFASFGVNVKPLVPTRKPAGSSGASGPPGARPRPNSVGAAARHRHARGWCTGDRAGCSRPRVRQEHCATAGARQRVGEVAFVVGTLVPASRRRPAGTPGGAY